MQSWNGCARDLKWILTASVPSAVAWARPLARLSPQSNPASGRARSLTAPERALYSRHPAAQLRSSGFNSANEQGGD